MKAILLARVSSKEQEEGQSIPSQVRRLTEYAIRKNLQVTQTFQITESSTKETRKQFDQIITLPRNQKSLLLLLPILLIDCNVVLGKRLFLMRCVSRESWSCIFLEKGLLSIGTRIALSFCNGILGFCLLQAMSASLVIT